MTSGNTNTNRWTTGSALPWLLGVTLGLIVGIALLIIIPRTLGGAAAPAATERPAETAAASAPAARGTEAAPAAATTPAPAAPAAATTPATNPAAASAAEGDSAAGKEKFTANCAGCHGANAEGGVGPALKVAKDWTPDQFTAAVREGKAPDKALAAMMPHFTTAQLSDADLTNIHAFIKTLN